MMMSFFNLFGKKYGDDTPSPQRIIQNMRETLSTLEKREKFIEKRIIDFKTDARLFIKTNKVKAIALLKQAKMNEKQLLSIYGQKENIELQIGALEQGISNKNTVYSLRQGKNAIEKISKQLDPDDICELMDDIGESIDAADEISNAMSTPVGQLYDDDELLSEFEEEVNEPITYEKVQLKVPTTNFSSTEETELEELEKMMLM